MLEQLQPDCYSKVAAFFDDNDTVLHCRCCWRDLQLELSMLMNRARLAFALTVEGWANFSSKRSSPPRYSNQQTLASRWVYPPPHRLACSPS